ncbi:hypothetical protein [Bradyrhizobium sp. JR3.5]
MTEGDVKAKLKSLAPNETFDLSDRVFADIFPDRSDAFARTTLNGIAASLECLFEAGPTEHTVRFVKVERESISDDDRKAIDLYYGYSASGGWTTSDVDRRKWIASRESSKNELLPIVTGLVGFGAAVVLLTPFGWVAAAGVAAVLGFNKLKKEWRKARTLAAYGRTFAFDGNGVVIGVTRD